MDSTRCVLATMKIIQLGMGIGCLALRESAHMNPDLPEVHNTLFCGTFMGFTIIAIALLLGYCIRKPAPKEVDLFFGFMGGVCFFLCGTLSMHYPTIDEKLMLLPPEEKAKYPFFILCSNIALACFANALLYIFEACVLYDIWYYELRRNKRQTEEIEKLAAELYRARQQARPSDADEDDEGRDGKMGRLQLRCFCLESAWRRIRRSRQRESTSEAAPESQQVSVVSAAESMRSISVPFKPQRQPQLQPQPHRQSQSLPQPGPSSAPDPKPGRRRSQSFSSFEQPRVAVSPPHEETDEDSDSRD